MDLSTLSFQLPPPSSLYQSALARNTQREMEESISTSVSTVRSMHQNFIKNDSQTSHHPKQWEHHASSSSGVLHGGEDLSETLKDNEHLRPVRGHGTLGTTTFGFSSASMPTSPPMHSLVLPSPPDSPGPSRSPSIDSVSDSSLPSVSSSFFFSSSAPGSPGRSHPGSYPSSHPHSDHEHEQGDDSLGDGQRPENGRLIIPSLSLPDALRRPTPFGQTLGNLKVLVLGGQGAGKSFLTGLLLEDNEDVVDVGTWEDWNGGTDAYGKVLRASTDWAEQPNVFGLERYEPTRNVEIVELPGYSHDTDVQELITRLKAVIEAPFQALHDVLHPESQPSATVVNMLAAPTSPLYTALVFLLPTPPTPLDKEIIQALSTDIPLIVLPRLSGPQRALGSKSSAKLSAFRPSSAVALRSGLFHSPETVALLRSEAVDRFMRWREVEKAVEEIWEGSHRATKSPNLGRPRREKGEPVVDSWNKAKWEAEWMDNYSRDVAVRMRQGTITDRRSKRRKSRDSASIFSRFESGSGESREEDQAEGQRKPQHAPFDPLHLPSLLMLSLSLLGPLKSKLGETVWSLIELLGDTRVQILVAGGFCVGLGMGSWMKT